MDTILDCTLDGMDFTCLFSDLTNNETTTDFGGHWDAVLSYQIEVGGQFTSDTDGSMYLGWTITCAGSECADLAKIGMPELPCTSQDEGTLTSM